MDVDRPALTSVYEVAGRFLLVKTSEPETASAIQQFFRRWELSRVEDHAELDPEAQIIFQVGRPREVEAHFKAFDLGDGITGFTAETAYCIQFPGSLITADESDVVRVWLQRPLSAGDDWLAQTISHSLSAALRRCGVFELHSGAVVDKSSKAVLICGPSGSGKSTLTLQLAANGWSYLSDDVVLLSFGGGRIQASGLRRFFALTRHTIDSSGLSQVKEFLSSKRNDDNPKQSLVPKELFPYGAIDLCFPNVIVFPLITRGSVSMSRELSATESMSRLIRLCPWSCYDSAVARDFLDLLAELVRQSTSYELLAGEDLLGDPAYTTEFLTKNLKARSQ